LRNGDLYVANELSDKSKCTHCISLHIRMMRIEGNH